MIMRQKFVFLSFDMYNEEIAQEVFRAATSFQEDTRFLLARLLEKAR